MKCAKCGRQVSGNGHPTPLGERVCASCHDTIAGAALGMMSGSNLGTESAVGGAVLGGGLMGWVRRMFGKKDRVTTDLTGVENARKKAAEGGRPAPAKKSEEAGPSGGGTW